MSIKVKEERLENAARAWEMAAKAWTKAAENWEDAEKAHPIGFINAIGREHARREAERIRNTNLDPRGSGTTNNP